jgi:hypothetical protein
MNEPDTHCENLPILSDAEKINLQRVYIMMGLPAAALLRLLVKVVTRL